MIKIARSISRSFVCALRIYVKYQASLISNVQCVKHLDQSVENINFENVNSLSK